MSLELDEIDVEKGRGSAPPREHSHANPAFEPGPEDRAEEGQQDDQNETADEVKINPLISCIVKPLRALGNAIEKHGILLRNIAIFLLALGYFAYMVVALVVNFHRAIPLLVIFCLVVFFRVYALIRDKCGSAIWKACKPAYNGIERNIYWIKWVFIIILIGLLATWIALDTSKRPNQLISMAGYVVLVFLLFLGSKHPGRVRWRPVFWGFGVQICLAFFILRTQPGFEIFNWVGYIAQTFLNFVEAGSKFVFGELYYQHFFAFKVLPIIIYISSFISIMYYLGAMQWIILKLSWVMQFSLGTSATESMCATGNIFIGMTESPLLIKPYIMDLTTSELHAVMVAGFGTIAGSVLGAYLEFGIQPYYVIPASVMAAPCSLAVAKLIYPETKRSKFMTSEGLKLKPSEEKNIIEAAFAGASAAVPLVLNIAATILAFIILLAAINAGLSWFGGMLDFPQLSFQLICSYIFLPVTYMMGIEWQDCFKCAELLGIKIFLNEFVAYEELGKMITKKENGTFLRSEDDGAINWISERSEAVITYALCGFANLGSVGIMLGGLGALCPERQGEIVRNVIRAMVGGVCVSLLNACLAGFLYIPPRPSCSEVLSGPNWNSTELDALYGCCLGEMKNVTSSMACRCCAFPLWTDNYNVTCGMNSPC